MLKRLAQAAVTLGASAALVGGGAIAANADPSYDAGCSGYSYTIDPSGWDALMETGGTFSVSSCWSGGTFGANQITLTNSNVQTVDGLTDKVEGVSGPNDSVGLPYANGQVIGTAGSADAYWTVKIASGIPLVTGHAECTVHVHLEPGSATWDGTC